MSSSFTQHRTPPLALTMGDPAGIGLEIALKAWLARHRSGGASFVLIADPTVVRERARSLGLDVPIAEVATFALDVGSEGRLPILPVRVASPVRAGHPDTANAAAVIESIERAVTAVCHGEASAVVTNPIAKNVLYDVGFAHPGHTEFLAALAERHTPGRWYRAVMMLACDDLRVVPLTIHIAISRVPAAITPPLILETVRITAAALERDFGLQRPRIAVAGLNPHAGEAGTIGTEDRDVIAPAIAALRAEGLAVSGPHPADTLFHAQARRGYDAVVAMYHDQAVLPIKTLAFDSAVNVTLGLPFVRTSPDHGTAFDIADRGIASPTSLIAALGMASEMAAQRARGGR